MNMTEVGRKIAALRRQKDMTQLELAALFETDLKKLATLVMKKEGISGLTPLAPFMRTSDLNAILSNWHLTNN